MAFAVSALAGLEHGSRGAPRLLVRFFGLFGPQGPMPLHLTEYVRERRRQHADPTPERFFDIFHHRLLSLFYRAWAQSQPVVQHDRPHDDRYAAWLGSTIGVAGLAPQHDALPPTARQYQAGLLASRSRHPEGLAKLLARHFGMAVRIEEHVPTGCTSPRPTVPAWASRATGPNASAAPPPSSAAARQPAARYGTASRAFGSCSGL